MQTPNENRGISDRLARVAGYSLRRVDLGDGVYACFWDKELYVQEGITYEQEIESVVRALHSKEGA